MIDPTLAEALRQATRDLAEAGIADAGSDARILLCAAAGVDRVALVVTPDRCLDPGAATRFEALLARRLAREPVSRILGRREFWGLDLTVTPDVLDPRPDTETLVGAAVRHVGRRRGEALTILDLGTGSGAILCALLAEMPAARGLGVDRSSAACRVAQANLARCGLGARSLVVQADWGRALASASFDLVVANPPYIETAIITTLAAEVRCHDPLAALDGGSDGLDAYRVLAAELPRLLRPGGATFLEVGQGQAAAVASLLAENNLTPGEIVADLAGIDRVVSAISDPTSLL